MRKGTSSKKETATPPVTVKVKPPKFERAIFTIVGGGEDQVPLVQNRFSSRAIEAMKAKQVAGSTANKQRGTRDPKDFHAQYLESLHVSTEGWYGLPAAAFRTALISVCRLVNFKMTFAKLSIFVAADGIDRVDAMPLVRITKGEPQYREDAVRNESGVADIRPRAMFLPGWEAQVRIRWDGDQFTLDDVTNLLWRVGEQAGIGEGRPDSRESCGLGWGLFTIKDIKSVKRAA